MSESLIVEVRRLRDAQEQVKQQLQDILSRIDPVAGEIDDLDEMLDALSSEVQRLVDSAAAI